MQKLEPCGKGTFSAILNDTKLGSVRNFPKAEAEENDNPGPLKLPKIHPSYPKYEVGVGWGYGTKSPNAITGRKGVSQSIR